MSMFDRDLSKWFDEAKRDGNPLLQQWFAAAAQAETISGVFSKNRDEWSRLFAASIENGTSEHLIRRSLVAQYSWAIPCETALDCLAKYAPLIEVGAGTGYWASLLRKMDVDIMAFDSHPPKPGSKNDWHQEHQTWTAVEQGDCGVIVKHPGRTLFLCWPPYDDSMATDCLHAYHGNHLAYVGEHGGCTANEEFFELLEQQWKEIESVDIPQWDGMHDYLAIYERI